MGWQGVNMTQVQLQDPELDATDPHTRLLLLAEHWKRKAHEYANACTNQNDELMRTWFVLKDFKFHPGRTEDRLSDCVRQALTSLKLETPAEHVEPVAWHVCSVNSDGSLSLEFAAPWEELAHDHISDAILDDIDGAGSWVVRPVYATPQPMATEPTNSRD
jgi:hypothetical protein